MSDTSTDQLTILRIKRKRTEEPLDALLVHQENEKRIKKNNEPSSSSTSSNTIVLPVVKLPTLFRLAETVEEKSFSDLKEAQNLKDRISRRIVPGVSGPKVSLSSSERREKLMKEQKEASHKARYKVINQNRYKKTEGDAPPVVQSASEKAASDLFQMYEAVKEGEESKDAKLFLDDDVEDPDDIMCNFIPMVKEYLTLNEKKEENEDDYVYDVYYRDDDNTESAINSKNIGELVWFDNESEYLDEDSDSELGDNVDEDSNAEDYYQNDYPEEEESDEDQYNYELSSEEEEYTM